MLLRSVWEIKVFLRVFHGGNKFKSFFLSDVAFLASHTEKNSPGYEEFNLKLPKNNVPDSTQNTELFFSKFLYVCQQG